INSQPVYVGAPGANVFRNRSFQGSNSYATFVTQKSGRTPVVYVGGNDGMLHGFNATVGQADSGKEIFAYIPHTVVKNGLGELARRDYEHRYFVDGELTVADAYDGTNWRTRSEERRVGKKQKKQKNKKQKQKNKNKTRR